MRRIGEERKRAGDDINETPRAPCDVARCESVDKVERGTQKLNQIEKKKDQEGKGLGNRQG